MAFPVITIIEGGELLILLPLGLMPPLVWGCYLLFGQVRRLEIDSRDLKIVYRLRRRKVALEEIAGWERIAKPSATSLYAASFSLHALKQHLAKELGPLEVIAAGITDFLLIRLRSRRPSLLVGPDDLDAFEQALREATRT
jgi:hypothetical protein